VTQTASTRIELVLQLAAPMHVADVGMAYHQPGRGWSPTKRPGDLVGSRTMRRRIKQPGLAADPLDEQSAEGGPSAQTVPIAPANTIGGGLRRACTSVVLDALARQNTTVHPALWRVMANGSAHGALQRRAEEKLVEILPRTQELLREQLGSLSGRDALNLAIRLQQEENVFLGLWGGGPTLVSSSVGRSDAIPIVPELIDTPAYDHDPSLPFADDLASYSVSQPVTEAAYLRRRDDVAERSTFGQAYESMMTESETTADEWMQAVTSGPSEAERTAGEGESDDEGDGSRSFVGLQLMSAMEVVSPGTTMHVSLPVQPRGSDERQRAQMALLVAGVQRWLSDTHLGGVNRLQFGRFAALDGGIRTPDGDVDGIHGLVKTEAGKLCGVDLERYIATDCEPRHLLQLVYARAEGV